jgi:hypothetical protein
MPGWQEWSRRRRKGKRRGREGAKSQKRANPEIDGWPGRDWLFLRLPSARLPVCQGKACNLVPEQCHLLSTPGAETCSRATGGRLQQHSCTNIVFLVIQYSPNSGSQHHSARQHHPLSTSSRHCLEHHLHEPSIQPPLLSPIGSLI